MKKRVVYTASTGARYVRLPWAGIQRFRREGGFCRLCGISDASHAVIGCDLGELL